MTVNPPKQVLETPPPLPAKTRKVGDGNGDGNRDGSQDSDDGLGYVVSSDLQLTRDTPTPPTDGTIVNELDLGNKLTVNAEEVKASRIPQFGINLESPHLKGVFHGYEARDLTKDENQYLISWIVDLLVSALDKKFKLADQTQVNNETKPNGDLEALKRIAVLKQQIDESGNTDPLELIAKLKRLKKIKGQIDSSSESEPIKSIQKLQGITSEVRDIAISQAVQETKRALVANATGGNGSIDEAKITTEITKLVDLAIQSINHSHVNWVFKRVGGISSIDFYGDVVPHILSIHPDAKRRYKEIEDGRTVIKESQIDADDLYQMGVDFLRDDLKSVIKRLIEAKVQEKMKSTLIQNQALSSYVAKHRKAMPAEDLRKLYIDTHYGDRKTTDEKYAAYVSDVEFMVSGIANELFKPCLCSTYFATDVLNPEVSSLLNSGELVSPSDDNLSASGLLQQSKLALSLHNTGLLSVATGLFINPKHFGLRITKDDLESIIKYLQRDSSFGFFGLRDDELSFFVGNDESTALVDRSKTLLPEAKIGEGTKGKEVKLQLKLADTDDFIEPHERPTTDFHQRVDVVMLRKEDVFNDMVRLFLESGQGVLSDEIEISNELKVAEKIQSRRRAIKTIGYSSAAVVAAALLGTLGTVAVHSHRAEQVKGRELDELKKKQDLREAKIEKLKQDIDVCTKPLEKLIKDEATKFEEKKQKAKNENKVDATELYFGTLAFYLERPPSDEELHAELEYFINHYKEFTSPKINLDQVVKNLLTNYLNGSINSEQLADELLGIGQIRKGRLPPILTSLQAVRALSHPKHKDKVSKVPGELEGQKIDDLRDLFSASEWYYQYRLGGIEIDGEEIPTEQIIPTIGRIVGTGGLINNGRSVIGSFVEDQIKGVEVRPLFKDTTYMVRAQGNVEILRQKINKRIETAKSDYKSLSQAQELLVLRNELDSTGDLEKLESQIRTLVDDLNHQQEGLKPLHLALAKCYVISSDLENMVNEHVEQLNKAVAKIQ